MTRLQQQRITLTDIIFNIADAAGKLNYYLVLDYCRRCEDCAIGHDRSAHKEARAVDVVLYHKATGAVCDARTPEGAAVFSALHDVADSWGAAKRIPGDLGHFSVADAGQVR